MKKEEPLAGFTPQEAPRSPRGTISSRVKVSVELPSRGDTEDVIAAVNPVVVDVQDARIEATDTDPAAVRVDIRTPDIDVREESLARLAVGQAGCQEVADHRVNDHSGSRRLLVLHEKRLLF